MYAREISGSEFTFGVSGKLIRNVLVMYDRQTESLWSQLLGEAVEGEMIGTKLEFLPSWMTTWAQWKEMHPDTVALDKNGRRGGRDVYDSYYASDRAGVIGRHNADERLYLKEFVIGMEVDGTAVAYPFSVLNDQPVVNDTAGGIPVLVAFDPETGNGIVFDRTLDGQVLSFSATTTPLRLTDAETGSTWDALEGTAVDGPLAGQQLQRLKSTRSFWFGWSDLYPQTRLYGVE